LLHISPSSRQRNHGHLVSSFHHEVKDATGEPCVDGKIVWETGEVVNLVAADEELAVDVEVGEVAGSQAGDIGEVVHLHPAPPASPANLPFNFNNNTIITNGGQNQHDGSCKAGT